MQEIPGYLESFVATGQLMEKLLIERVAFFSNACGHENVTSDELMNNLAVGGHAAKGNVDVALKLDGHLGDWETHKHSKKSYESSKMAERQEAN